jgi:response regulator RpfG family c-di-GMP phosphodiesterase
MNKGILLCVDDENIVLNALKDQLRKAYGAKHVIEVAESAEEGLEILDELVDGGYLPLVIISDWLMPRMTGDAFLIEAHKRFPYVVKILLSGQADEQAVQRTREQANLHEFMAKPWEPDKLIRCINEGLEVFYQKTSGA